MQISVQNYNNKSKRFYIIDTTPELNVPRIPENCSLVFKEKYTNKIKVLSNDDLQEIFLDNKLLYDITIFDNIFIITENEIRSLINERYNDLISNFCILNNKNISLKKHNIFFTKTNLLYTKHEFDKEMNELENKCSTLENKISSLLQLAKKEEIFQELQNIENQIH